MSGQHEKYRRLVDFCKTLPRTPTAVAHPCDESSLTGAVDALVAQWRREAAGKAVR